MIYIKDEAELKLSGLSVVKFYLDVCNPCKRLDTILKKMETEFTNVNFYSMNVDNFVSFAKKYEIKTVPTLIFFDNTKNVNKVAGLMSTDFYRSEFKKFTNQ